MLIFKHMDEITPKASTILTIGPVDITNAMFTSIVVSIILVLIAYFAGKNLKIIPGRIQSLTEVVIESLKNLFGTIMHNGFEYTFPFVATFFIFILTSNWFGLTPFAGDYGIEENGHLIHLFKPVNSDLNATIAFGLISVIGTQYYGIKISGLKNYLKKFLGIAGAIEGILEPTKIISLSFRLFGNIFAGDVVISSVSTKIFPLFIPIPFMALEVGVGFLQALIFTLLTAVSISLVTNLDHE